MNGVGVDRNRTAKRAGVGRVLSPIRCFPPLLAVPETILGEGRPDGEAKGIGMIDDRNFDMATNEIPRAVDDAKIRGQFHPPVEFIFRHETWPWSVKAEAERELVVLQAARFAFPAHDRVSEAYIAPSLATTSTFWRNPIFPFALPSVGASEQRIDRPVCDGMGKKAKADSARVRAQNSQREAINDG
jgi:hypothetical protein